MSLENLNLVELNAQEKKEIDGGFWHYVIGAIAYFCVETITNPISSNNALTSGYNAGKK